MKDKNNIEIIRESNLELLRLFCIITIIADHFVGQSGIARFDGLFASFFYSTITSLSRVSCSVFIIISSWFLVDSEFRIKRVLHTWLTVIMYTVPITCYVYLTREGIDKFFVHQAFLPIQGSPLWFASYYIILVFLSPLLNILINQQSRKKLELAIFFLFVFMVLYATITASGGYFTHEIWILIFLYLVTAYFKRYKIKIQPKVCLVSFLLIESVICITKALTSYYAGLNLKVVSILANYAEYYRARLQTIPNLIMAFSLFFIFYNLKIRKSRIINKLATTTLGIYCFHQVPVFYTILWKEIFHADYFINRGGRLQYVYTIAVILCVWILGSVIEMVRNKISYILIESRKYYFNVCTRIDNLVCTECKMESDRRLWGILIVVITIYYICIRIIAL